MVVIDAAMTSSLAKGPRQADGCTPEDHPNYPRPAARPGQLHGADYGDRVAAGAVFLRGRDLGGQREGRSVRDIALAAGQRLSTTD
jgi:hypothetical protein